jgi:alpha-tubulin suppressor-like RCC1 family protein
LTGVTEIVAGNSHALARKSDGTVWAWGWNSDGQLGNNTSGTGNSSTLPVQVPINNVSGIAAGGGHSIALKND